MLKRLAYTVGALIFALALFSVWYSIAANYNYNALSGTYEYAKDGITSTLYLKKDGTFQQKLVAGDNVDISKGTWRRIGEGGVAFSKDFMRLPGQLSYLDKFGPDPNGNKDADTDFGGHFEKVLTLFPVLYVDGKPNDLKFSKRLLIIN